MQFAIFPVEKNAKLFETSSHDYKSYCINVYKVCFMLGAYHCVRQSVLCVRKKKSWCEQFKGKYVPQTLKGMVKIYKY